MVKLTLLFVCRRVDGCVGRPTSFDDTSQIRGGYLVARSYLSKNLRSICDKDTMMLRLKKRVTGKDRKALVS